MWMRIVGMALLFSVGCKEPPPEELPGTPPQVSSPGSPPALDSGGVGIVPLGEMDLDGAVPKEASAPPEVYELTEQFIEIAGTRMRVLRKGAAGAPPVVFLHGATFRAELWEELGTMDVLAENGYHVISADLPGHGKSRRPAVKREVLLENMLDALGVINPVVFGHSYAGTFIYPAILKEPSILRAVILVSPVKVRQNVSKLNGSPLPVMVMWGENDELIPVAQANVLVNAFPNGKKVILEGAMHECYNDATGLFHAHILDFLNHLDK